MGSIGEEELVQMVRDFIELGSGSPINPLLSSSLPLSHNHQQPALQEILSEATEFETQVLDKVLMYVRNMGEPNSLKKWVVKRLLMDGFDASLCKTFWVSTFSPKVFQFVGDYEYIEVMMEDGKRIIVDMDFKTQFGVARPTQTYKDLTNSLPSIFVGTEERLQKVISILCSAAKQSLKEKGLHIPPWRKAKYMQSKWLSKNCKKISVLSELGSDNSNNTCCPSIF